MTRRLEDEMRWIHWRKKGEGGLRTIIAFDNPIGFTNPDGMKPWPVALFIFTHNPKISLGIGHDLIPGDNISSDAWRIGKAVNKEIIGEGVYNDRVENAIRHVAWQASITSEYGNEIATEIGNAHEDNPNADLKQRTFTGKEEADQTVDLLNNIIGRQIGDKNRGASSENWASKAVTEFHEHGLYTATPHYDKNGDVSSVTVGKTKLTDNQRDVANAAIKASEKKHLEERRAQAKAMSDNMRYVY